MEALPYFVEILFFTLFFIINIQIIARTISKLKTGFIIQKYVIDSLLNFLIY